MLSVTNKPFMLTVIMLKVVIMISVMAPLTGYEMNGCHDIHYNDTQYKDTHYNDT
jgi:hypothetical protein